MKRFEEKEKRKQNRLKQSIIIRRETGKTIQNDSSLLTENSPVTRFFLKGVSRKMSVLMLPHLSNVNLAFKA